MLNIANNKFIGLDIGHGHLIAVRLKNDEAVEIGEYPLATGIIDHGQVRDSESLTESLRSFWADMKLKTRKVHFAIGSPRVLVTTIDIPLIDDPEELRQAISFNIADRLTYDLDEAVIDYTPATSEPRIQERRRYVVAAAPKEVVMGYIQAVRRAHLETIGVQLIPFALLQSIRTDYKDTEQESISVVCHIGSNLTSIGVAHQDDCLFAHFSSSAGMTITNAIQEKTQVTVEEAERMKCALGLSEAATDEKEETAQRAINDAVDSLSQTIHEAVSYYQGQEESRSRPVAQLILSGGGAYLKGLPQYLEGIFSLPVHVVEPAPGLAVHEMEYFGHWAVAYGLARTNKVLEGGAEKTRTKKGSLGSLSVADKPVPRGKQK